MTPELISIRKAQETLGDVGRTKIYELIKQGHLTKVSIGTRSLIVRESISAYITWLGGRPANGAEHRNAQRVDHRNRPAHAAPDSDAPRPDGEPCIAEQEAAATPRGDA